MRPHAITLSLLLALAALPAGADTSTGDCPKITYTPEELNWDGGVMNVAVDETVTVTNACTTGPDLDITVTTDPGRGPFSRVSHAEMLIPAGTSQDIIVEYLPDTASQVVVVLNIESAGFRSEQTEPRLRIEQLVAAVR